VRRLGGKPVIPPRSNSPRRRYDKALYKLRNVVERHFNRLKHCRRVATRYDKTAVSYHGFLCVAAMKYSW
jgi:transposase